MLRAVPHVDYFDNAAEAASFALLAEVAALIAAPVAAEAVKH